MGMIVTLYLISANVYNSVDAPKNRGFSYIEIWMLGSQVPILVALLEYGYVLYLKKVVKISNQDEMKIFEDKIKKLDLVTMIFSFCSFTMFASIYWIVTLTWAWSMFYPLDTRNSKKPKIKSFYKQQPYFSQIVSKKAKITISVFVKNSKNNNFVIGF